MKQFKFRSITCGILGTILLLGTAAPLTFTACENEHPEISITLTSDYSGIIDAINNVNKTLLEKLALIEQGIKDGNLQNQQALDLIQKAIEAMNGTLEQKLDAIKSVIESQTTSLETKLALIETAIKNGLADNKAAQELIKSAIESLSGSLETKLDAIKTAIESQTTSLETKLAAIETAVKNGFADSKTADGLIQTALESLTGSLEEKLAAIETAIKSQTTSLETKLDLIEAALKAGFTDQKTALGEIKSALESIKGSVDGLDSAIDDIVASIDAITDALGDLNDTAGATNDALTSAIADALADIFDAIDGLTDYSDILEAIKTAIENIEISGGGEDEGGDDSGDDGTVVLKLTPLDIHGNPVDIIIPWNPKYSDNIKDTLIAKILVEGDRMKLVGPDETNTWNAETNTDYSEGIGAITNHTNHSQCIDVCLVSAARYGESDSTYVYCIRKYDAEEGVTYEGRFNYVVKARPAVAPGTINGYAYVEMGDGLKWATMNVGATKPEEYGDYFAWGETEAKADYSWGTYTWMKEGYSAWNGITKYTSADGQTDGIWYEGDTFVGDNKTSLVDYAYADDAARQIWKGSWRIPTDAEWKALLDEAKFDWTRTDDYEGTGKAGMVVTSKVSGYEGNSIFLPAAGNRDGTSPFNAGSRGYYWSSSLSGNNSDYSWQVFFNSEEAYRSYARRYYGYSVRPVSE